MFFFFLYSEGSLLPCMA